jgi:hypothetical protein
VIASAVIFINGSKRGALCSARKLFGQLYEFAGAFLGGLDKFVFNNDQKSKQLSCSLPGEIESKHSILFPTGTEDESTAAAATQIRTNTKAKGRQVLRKVVVWKEYQVELVFLIAPRSMKSNSISSGG